MAIQAQRFLNSRTRWIVFALIVGLSVYLLAVTPVHTYLDQRAQMEAAEKRYELLAGTDQQMQEHVQELQSDEAIEALARERYELVPPGTQSYAVMPPPVALEPDAVQTDKNDGLWNTVWDGVTFWN